MRRWVIVLLLVMVSAIASAQPARTQRAQETATSVERQVGSLVTKRNALASRYETELKGIDRLKMQRASWKRDRELRDQLSKSLETANQLAAVTRELQQAHTQLAAARRGLVDAIDAELKAGATGARAQQLQKLRGQLVPTVHRAKRIVIPDTEIDPYADPEDLEQQAKALRESEVQLQRQIVGLEQQAKELERVASLRKQHDRAGDLARRDDDQPRRGTPASNQGKGGIAAEDAGPTSGTPGQGGGGSGSGGGPPPSDNRDPSSPSSVESDAPVVLQDVVDPATIDSLQKAQRSGDPAQRAAAAKRARDAVQSRLDQVRAKRAAIEARAKQLRGR